MMTALKDINHAYPTLKNFLLNHDYLIPQDLTDHLITLDKNCEKFSQRVTLVSNSHGKIELELTKSYFDQESYLLVIKHVKVNTKSQRT